MVNGRTFQRYVIQTHKVMFGEDLAGVIEQYAGPYLTATSIICLSQKLVSISTNHVRHISTVQDGWLARQIVKHVTRHPGAIGWEHPKKMQVAIETAGYPRILAGVVIGGLTRLLLKRRGDFWRIAGNHTSEIDGFNPIGIKPFDEYAMLPPPEPDAICDRLAQRFGCGVSILDANDIDVQVVGVSSNLRRLGMDKALIRKLNLDNPMSQEDTLTPIVILDEVRAATRSAPTRGA